MDFKTAQPIIDACVKKAEEGIWGYTSRPDSYSEAVRDWEKRRNNWDVDTNMMSWSLGVVSAMASMIRLFSKGGDKVLIQTPVYSEFYDIVESAGRVVVENKLKEENRVWNVDFDDFEEKAKDCSIFLLCSPHNPLGIVWSREELIKMEEICRKNDVLLISDEIHSDLIFHGKKHIPTASLSENAKKSVITCVSATKTFNLAGLQAATIIFPDSDKKKIFDSYWFNMEYAVNYIGHNEFSIIKL